MNEVEIFNHLFEIAKKSHDPRGVVSACLINGDEIITSSASADDGKLHAEEIVIEKGKEDITNSTVLYSTLEPCSQRKNKEIIDCTTVIINSGIKNVIFGAKDPEHSSKTHKRLGEKGISIRQTTNPDIIKKCAQIFNGTVLEKDVKLKPED
ncbi:MAG TPA: deaminase [Candidatus Moranbacteria bacterium]|nr:deaminase [Candidatus Moranbacteria bacterium]